MQGHFLAQSICAILDFRAIFGRHFVEQFLELSGHFHPPYTDGNAHSPSADKCSSKSLSAIGTNSSYQRSLPVLSPPTRSSAVRRGSNANRTRYGLPACWTTSSFMLGWREAVICPRAGAGARGRILPEGPRRRQHSCALRLRGPPTMLRTPAWFR